MATSAPTLNNITLTPELEEFVRQGVASGQYHSASELVQAALQLLERREAGRAEAFTSLKQKLQRGAEQEQRGELCDGDAFMEQLLARLRKGELESGAA
jgi:antitoxin ParD1/3/4